MYFHQCHFNIALLRVTNDLTNAWLFSILDFFFLGLGATFPTCLSSEIMCGVPQESVLGPSELYYGLQHVKLRDRTILFPYPCI